ncbi:hypothetical protein SISNIDRAFT_488153 [Sistotremastrum niveocremeum HHB9708]|uniref:Uncharacterized protein n=1 Tax=Sistotremastrum niveocremeum HHB9708 TaxID=1314777 RepID=A0A164RI16_9AGAM|nr:hypothetical protein SISNIDRAFT_488153 [Sistotremastrum niveocremeum HHB9708]
MSVMALFACIINTSAVLVNTFDLMRNTPEISMHAAWQLLLVQVWSYGALLERSAATPWFTSNMLQAGFALSDLLELQGAAASVDVKTIGLLRDVSSEAKEVIREYQRYQSRVGSAIDRSIYANNHAIRSLRASSTLRQRLWISACTHLPTLLRLPLCRTGNPDELSTFHRVQDAALTGARALEEHATQLQLQLQHLRNSSSLIQLSPPSPFQAEALSETMWDFLLKSLTPEVAAKFRHRHPHLHDLRLLVSQAIDDFGGIALIIQDWKRRSRSIDPHRPITGFERLPTRAETLDYLFDVKDRLISAQKRASRHRNLSY